MKRVFWKRGIVGILTLSMLLGQCIPAVSAAELTTEDNENTFTTQMEEPETPTTPTEEEPTDGVDASLENQENTTENTGTENTPTDTETENTQNGAPESDSSQGDNTNIIDTLADPETENPPETVAETNEMYSLNDMINLSNGKIVQGESKLTVKDATGVILLSHVNPEEYKNATIELVMTDNNVDVYDLVQTVPVEHNGNAWDWGFLGLGSEAAPFQGTLNYAAGSEKSWMTTHSIFNAISGADVLPSAGISFRLFSSDIEGKCTNTTEPLLAVKVTNVTSSFTWAVSLISGASDDTGIHQIGGIIGSMADSNVSLSLTISDSNPILCQASGDTGLLCGNAQNSSLTASVSGNTSNVTVKSTSGNSGGLVGSATNLSISVLDGLNINLSGITVIAADNAGGLVGSYTYDSSGKGTFDLSNITLNTTFTGGSHVGGVVGTLTNSESFEFTGGSVTSALSSGGSNYGGIIGQYSSSGISKSLRISDCAAITSTASGKPSVYGGVIGTISNSAYVEIEALSNVTTSGDASTSFGGLVGVLAQNGSAFLNIGSVKLARTVAPQSARNAVGGLVGYLKQGVVRLYGETDLSDMALISLGSGTGQIVGKNDNGLVYAVVTGSDITSGWLLKRYSSTTASDIGNWGQVVRLDGTKLKEVTETSGDDAALFYFNKTDHTVTVLGNPTCDYTISSVRDFAAYALTYDFGGVSQDALIFSGTGATNVKPNNQQKVQITNDIDLIGTGILGIGRDNGTGVNGTGNADSNFFVGTISGALPTTEITLDIGNSVFGENSSDKDPSGWGGLQIYNDAHNFLGLLPVAGGTTIIENLTIAGDVVGYNNNKNNNNSGRRIAGAIGYCRANPITFNNVTVSANVTVSGDSSWIYQGGFFGDMVNGKQSVSFNHCIWSGTLTNSIGYDSNRYSRIGGFAAYIQKDTKTITVNDCTLRGGIEANSATTAHMGGLFADFEDGQNTTLTISQLSINGVNLSAASATGTSGGLLGYSWPKVNVIFDGTSVSGVKVQNSTLNANSARFGGLVYQATGYWKATAANSIHFALGNSANSFMGSSTQTDPSGLLVGKGLITSNNQNNALYLEVGTWGTSDTSAYQIEEGSVTVTVTSNYFDELVGTTINDNAGNDNAVVSLATAEHNLIDSAVYNTYTHQLSTTYQNSKTRYYYNLDSYRTSGTDGAVPAADSLSSPGQVLSWSVSQYAASNIRNYFCSNPNDVATITGNIALTGYSYYPVTPLAAVSVTDANLAFAFTTMNEKEIGKKPFDSDTQHYLMHYGLLYNTRNSVTISDTHLSGTVGKTAEGSGALILGEVTGNSTKTPTVALTGITLDGLRVSGVESTTVYAPLLINKIKESVSLSVNNLTTGAEYNNGSDTLYAASSLIGKVGHSGATGLNLQFKNIALDSRSVAGTQTYVWNNGQSESHKVEYNTYHSIFTQAILLDSFQYTSESNGTYNFNSTDNKVTYGVEISNTDSGRNPKEQYFYYDQDVYVWDGVKTKPTEETITTYYSSGNVYLRYVREPEADGTENYRELDINIRVVHLDQGCGTYGDPYLITEGAQLVALANFLNAGSTSGLWAVKLNNTVYNEQTQVTSTTCYHTFESGSEEDVIYLCEGTRWYLANPQNGSYTKGDEKSDITVGWVRAYLRNAYYQIQKDITISNNSYTGIGGNDVTKAFSGVIVGKALEDGKFPTVTLSVNSRPTETGFGGLIQYSQGSVVKDLNISYEGSITMTNNAVPTTDKNPFFGGVVGYCMGGDTIIDNVSVEYGENSVSLSGDKARLIAAGGYVGLVGGAKNSSGCEKTGGGVVFRNMESTSNNFGSYQSNASADSTYFYCNPYVGRVLDGYACSEGSSVNNTDKNYTIPQLTAGTNDLVVGSDFSVTVNSAQGLWLLSAIVNSGAGAMDSNDIYGHQYCKDKDSSEGVDAYNLGKPRTVKYDKIGELDGDISDEKFWGGTENAVVDRVSYLVRTYTAQDDKGGYPAAKIAGGNPLQEITLTFSEGIIDISTYGNGFRGIGSSFAKGEKTWNNSNAIRGRFLRVKNINPVKDGQTRGNVTIKLGIDRHDYCENYYNNGWFAQGAGLFVGFTFVNGCKVDYLTLSGKSKLTLYSVSDGSEAYFQKGSYEGNGEVPVGGFAGRTANSSGSLYFNHFRLEGLTVYGGHHAAGTIGLLEKTGGKKDITFNDWYIGKDSDNNKVFVSKMTDNDGSSAGLLGWCHGENASVTLNGVGLDSDDWNVNDVMINSVAKNKNSAASAGLIGACDGYNVIVSGVRAKELTITGEKMRETGGLVDASDKIIKIQNCWIENISVMGKNGSGPVGGVLGSNKTNNATIDNVTITGENVSLKSLNSSAGYIGGIVGKSNNATVNNCHITGTTSPVEIEGQDFTGGLIGQAEGRSTVSGCTLTNVHVLSTGNDASGLITRVNGESATLSNVTFSNVIVATKNKNSSVGLLTGYINGKTINGYNILAASCQVGYSSANDIASLTSITESTNTNTGLWMGGSSGTSTLVAVAMKGECYPTRDVGSGTAQITYADYPVDQTNKAGSSAPWLDVNPTSTLQVKETSTSAVKTLIGNAVSTMIVDGETKSVAQVILNESNTVDKRYWNLTDSSALLQITNPVYLTTYQTEEGSNTVVPSDTDFPILVVNTNENSIVNTQIWNFIAAMTNVSSGENARAQVKNIDIGSYKWNDSSFTKVTNASLTYTGSTKFIRTNGRYDNTLSQITVLDVQYQDPTDDSNTFHLYVPILVKKVLQVKVSVNMQEGTNYCADDYTSNQHVAAGFGDNITAFIEFNYQQTQAEWQTALDQGDNLLWMYKKRINLSESAENLPAGTRLTLLDKQTGNVFTRTLTATDEQAPLDFETIFDGWLNSPVCDLLDITAEDNDSGDYVETADESVATVRVAGENGTFRYFRPKVDSDTSNVYKLTVGDDIVDSDKYLKQGDCFYLTISVPARSSASVVNNLMNYSGDRLEAEKGTNAPPTNIFSQTKNRYCLYDGVEQKSFTVGTSRINGGNHPQGDETTAMANDDSIQITLEVELGLHEDQEIKNMFKTYTPKEMYQQFAIDLKKYTADGTSTNVAIGASSATWKYSVYNGDTLLCNTDEEKQVLQGENQLLISYGGENLPIQIKTADDSGNSLRICATITLYYDDIIEQGFPPREGDDTTSGIYVQTESRLANRESLLSITSNKQTKEDEKRYYTESTSFAKLEYDIIQKETGVYNGDKNAQLGINPDDPEYSSLAVDTVGRYDYSNVSDTTLEQAKQIRYSIELYQKDNNGTYNMANPLSLAIYWTDFQVQNVPVDQLSGTNWVKDDSFEVSETRVCSIPIQFSVKTGTAFETAGLTYANYKVRLTAVLLDKDGRELKETEATDYIIYTNARVYPQIITPEN